MDVSFRACQAAEMNCQELTVYEWSYLGDAVEDQQLHVEVLMDTCQARQCMKTGQPDLETWAEGAGMLGEPS